MSGGRDPWQAAGTNIQAAFIVIAVLYFISYPAYFVLLINTLIVDTYAKSPSTWGIYYTCRFNSVGWWALFLSAARILVPVVMFVAIGTRRVKGCITFHTLLFMLMFIMECVVCIGLSYLAGTCNQPGTKGYLCCLFAKRSQTPKVRSVIFVTMLSSAVFPNATWRVTVPTRLHVQRV